MASTKIRLIFVFSFILLSFTNSANAIEDFRQWCGKTTHSQICILLISQYPAGNLKTEPSGFCWILNDKARDIAGKALNKISDLLQGSVSSADRELFQDADALYADIDYIVYNFDFSALNHQNYPLFNRDLKKAIRGVAQSKSVFDKLSAYRSSFTKINHILGIIIETISQIVNLNECKKIQTCT